MSFKDSCAFKLDHESFFFIISSSRVLLAIKAYSLIAIQSVLKRSFLFLDTFVIAKAIYPELFMA